MNKVFVGLILAVCVLGMALVMLNDRLGRRPENRIQPEVSEAATKSRAEMEASERAKEIAEAANRQETPTEAPTPPSALVPEAMPVQDTSDAPVITEVLPKPAVNEKPAVTAVAPPPAQIAEQAKPAQPKAPAQPRQENTAAPAQKPEETAQAKPEATRPANQNQPETAAKPQGNVKNATRFVVYARDKGATVRMGGDSKMEYNSMTLDDPNRVVVDIPGEWKFPATTGIPKNELVSAVRVGKHGDKTRIVIDLKEKPRKVVLVPFKDGRGVDVRVDK